MHDIVLIKGDGIGIEITEAVKKIIEATDVSINYHECEIGATSYEKYGC